MNAAVDEVAENVFRITTFVPDINLGFSQFLVRDEEPLLFHTGMRGLFPLVHEAVGTLIDPADLRWIGFSHFEADECGSLNEWLDAAPNATAVCTLVGAMVSVNDFASRDARPLQHEEVLSTGQYRFRQLATPHVPHCWEAGVLFEETAGILFASDILGQNGDVPPTTESDVIDQVRAELKAMNEGPLANYLPFTPQTVPTLHSLAALSPRMIATMHGSVLTGDCSAMLRDYAGMLAEEIGS
jgi:flavorubredoxin